MVVVLHMPEALWDRIHRVARARSESFNDCCWYMIERGIDLEEIFEVAAPLAVEAESPWDAMDDVLWELTEGPLAGLDGMAVLADGVHFLGDQGKEGGGPC